MRRDYQMDLLISCKANAITSDESRELCELFAKQWSFQDFWIAEDTITVTGCGSLEPYRSVREFVLRINRVTYKKLGRFIRIEIRVTHWDDPSRATFCLKEEDLWWVKEGS